MSSLEPNKIFAALLVAGITAMLSGFVAEHLVHAEPLETNAVNIEGGAPAGGGETTAAADAAEPILHLLAAADVTKGEKIAKACAACHSFDKGGADKVGPNLWGIVDRPKGAHGSFAYSDGMKTHGGVWSYGELSHFLRKPKAFIPDTKMTFIGVKKPEDRAAVIAWLRTLSDSPAPLPSEADIAAESPSQTPTPQAPEGAPATTEEVPAAPAEATPPAEQPQAPAPAEEPSAPAH